MIPQLARKERLTPEQLEEIYINGPTGELIPLGTFATIKDTVTPRSLNRFQQLNAVTLSGVAIRPLDEVLGFLETEAEKLLPQGYTVDYTGESRQLRKEANTFIPAFGLAILLIFLVLAAQFNGFPRSVRDSRGLGPAGHVRRIDLHVPEDARSERELFHRRLDDYAERLFAGGARDIDRAHL